MKPRTDRPTFGGTSRLFVSKFGPISEKKTSLRPQRRCFDRARLRLQPSINAPTIGAYLVENVLRERDIQKSTSAQRERITTASTCGQHSSCFRASTMGKIRFEVRARPSERWWTHSKKIESNYSTASIRIKDCRILSLRYTFIHNEWISSGKNWDVTRANPLVASA